MVFWQVFVLLVILFEIDCAIFYTNLHEFLCQFISWTNWVNSGKFMDNCWISCQVTAEMKKVYDDLIIINLYLCLFVVVKVARDVSLQKRQRPYSATWLWYNLDISAFRSHVFVMNVTVVKKHSGTKFFLTSFYFFHSSGFKRFFQVIHPRLNDS